MNLCEFSPRPEVFPIWSIIRSTAKAMTIRRAVRNCGKTLSMVLTSATYIGDIICVAEGNTVVYYYSSSIAVRKDLL